MKEKNQATPKKGLRIEEAQQRKEDIQQRRGNVRGKGRLNKISREAIAHALEGHAFKIKIALDQILQDDPKMYIDAISKLLNYTVPKLSSTEIKDSTTKRVEVVLDKDATIDDLKNQLREIDQNR